MLLAVVIFTAASRALAYAEQASAQSLKKNDLMAPTLDVGQFAVTRSRMSVESGGPTTSRRIVVVDTNGDSSVHYSSGTSGRSLSHKDVQGQKSRPDETHVSSRVLRPATLQETFAQLPQFDTQPAISMRGRQWPENVATGVDPTIVDARNMRVTTRRNENTVQVNVNHAGAINLMQVGPKGAYDVFRVHDSEAILNMGADYESNITTKKTVTQARLVRDHGHTRLSAASLAYFVVVDFRHRLGGWSLWMIFFPLFALAIAYGFKIGYAMYDSSLWRRLYSSSVDSRSSTNVEQERFSLSEGPVSVSLAGNDGTEAHLAGSDYEGTEQPTQPTVLLSHPSEDLRCSRPASSGTVWNAAANASSLPDKLPGERNAALVLYRTVTAPPHPQSKILHETSRTSD